MWGAHGAGAARARSATGPHDSPRPELDRRRARRGPRAPWTGAQDPDAADRFPGRPADASEPDMGRHFPSPRRRPGAPYRPARVWERGPFVEIDRDDRPDARDLADAIAGGEAVEWWDAGALDREPRPC